MYKVEDLSSPYIYALLLSNKIDYKEAADRYLLPLSIFEEVYGKFGKFIHDRNFRMGLIEELLGRGESPEKIAESIDWRDFEYIVGEYFRAYNFSIIRNFRLKHPRLEIDIVAVKGLRVLCIDCKNWDKRLSPGLTSSIVSSQVKRCRALCVNNMYKGYTIYPIIVVMRRGKIFFFDGVPVIPVTGLKNFLNELDSLILNKDQKFLSC